VGCIGSSGLVLETKKALQMKAHLTTHSTGAELARMSSLTWMLFYVVSRPVNSGVRLLLNALHNSAYSLISPLSAFHANELS
jgi:hypothetical protein